MTTALRETLPARHSRLNVLLLCADDHRADAFGVFGPPCLRTPCWDRMMREGSSFTRAYTTIPICRPARAELLSGCSALRNGVQWFGEALDPGLKTLPVTLAEAGYTTFFTGGWDNDGEPATRGYQIARRVHNGGMSMHSMRFEEEGGAVTGFSSELFADAAIDFLRDPGDRPWFAHVAFTAPHDPRTPPAPWRPDPADVPLPPNFMPVHPFDNGAMTIRDELLEAWPRTHDAIRNHLADYYGMLMHMDNQVGRVLQALEDSGQADRTIVIYTGDHGLAVGSHGLMGKENMYEHSVRVPLILRGPGIPAGRSYAALCYAYDLYATICELTDVPVPPGLDSRGLKAVLCGMQFTHRDAIVCFFSHAQRMIETQRWKLTHYPGAGRQQLFDLQDDPHELTDLLEGWRWETSPWYAPNRDGAEFRSIADDLYRRLKDIDLP